MHEARAKALMEFFRGERPWPRLDEEVSENLVHCYAANERLHPWLNHGNEPILDRFRALLVDYFPETGNALFQEMLDRQAEIDQTGIMLDSDWEFAVGQLVERGIEIAADARRRRQAMQDGLRNREHDVRSTRNLGEANRERSQVLELESLQSASIRRFLLELLSMLLIGETMDLNQIMEEARRRGLVIQQEAPPVEQPNGLYEFDPSCLLNFDDWCAENSNIEAPYTELDLRRDINGWFQHLRNCESQARLDWVPFAETFRDAILTGDRCHYDYAPTNNLAWQPLTFRNWCLENADPAEIRISPMNSIFINLLQGYTEYLIGTESLEDLAAFQRERSARVQIMRDHLAKIPGAPISRNLNDIEMMEDTPSNRQMCDDIDRLSREGGLTTEADIQQRHAQIARLFLLRMEANAVHESRLPGYRIEREEREQRAREELEETDNGDDGLFMFPVTQQVHNVRRGDAIEQRRQRYRAEQQRQDENDGSGGLVLTTGIQAVIQSRIARLHSGTHMAQISGENLGGPAARNYDEWQAASTGARAGERARREAEDEADGEEARVTEIRANRMAGPSNFLTRPRS